MYGLRRGDGGLSRGDGRERTPPLKVNVNEMGDSGVQMQGRKKGSAQ